ncbi:unnamed protein product [Gordionus sp. m RMFG-2023]
MFPDEGSVEPLQMDENRMEEEQSNVEISLNENPLIIEDSHLDLEMYTSYYRGIARLQRLLYVADHCKSLELEALKMIVEYIMGSGADTTLYLQCYERIAKCLLTEFGNANQSGMREYQENILYQNAGIPPLDREWVENVSKKAALKLEKLDTDLKNYKNNFIKESIRRGHYDLGEHYLVCGDLNNALKCFCRPRDYCTTPKHIVTTCLNVMRVSIYLRNWNHVLNYAIRAETTINPELAALTSNGNSSDNRKDGDKITGKTTSRTKTATTTNLNTGTSNRLVTTSTQDTSSQTVLNEEQGSIVNDQFIIAPTLAPAQTSLSSHTTVTLTTSTSVLTSNQITSLPNAPSTSAHYFYSSSLSKVAWMAGLAEMCSSSTTNINNGIQNGNMHHNFEAAARRFASISNVDHVTPSPSCLSWQMASGGDALTQQQQQPLIIRPLDKRHPYNKHPVSSNLPTYSNSVSSSTTQPALVLPFEDSNAYYVVSPNNVAWYAGLCGLATFEREALKRLFLSGNCPFKQFLELEPCLREILYSFYQSKYQDCLSYLDDVKDQLMLDLYLGPVLDNLYDMIRTRAIIQYITPYSKVCLESMYKIFYPYEISNQSINNVNNEGFTKLESEIGNLIHKEVINGKIDSYNKVLYIKNPDDRKLLFSKTLKSGAFFQKNCRSLLVRAAILDSNIVVKK